MEKWEILRKTKKMATKPKDYEFLGILNPFTWIIFKVFVILRTFPNQLIKGKDKRLFTKQR